MAYITEKTLIGEIVNTYPETIETLLSVGMHCLGCPASQAESLEDACAVHGLDPVVVAKAVNAAITAERGEETILCVLSDSLPFGKLDHNRYAVIRLIKR